MICPFCKCDPYEYVDIGVGYAPVAVTCCDMGIAWLAPCSKAEGRAARRVLRLRRSHSPRHKARAKKLLQRMESGEYA